MNRPASTEENISRLRQLANKMSAAINEASADGAELMTLRLELSEAENHVHSVNFVASHYADIVMALEDQGFEITVGNDGVHVRSPDGDAATAQVGVLSALLRNTLPENMGGYPSLHAPDGGWESHEKAAKAALEKAEKIQAKRQSYLDMETSVVESFVASIQKEFAHEGQLSEAIVSSMRDSLSAIAAGEENVSISDMMSDLRGKLISRLDENLSGLAHKYSSRFDDEAKNMAENVPSI